VPLSTIFQLRRDGSGKDNLMEISNTSTEHLSQIYLRFISQEVH